MNTQNINEKLQLKPIKFNRAYSSKCEMITCQKSTLNLSKAYNIT